MTESDARPSGEVDQPTELPNLESGDKIIASTRYRDRTLTVSEVREDSYMLTGYGTKYQLVVVEKHKAPDWVALKWQSQPEGAIITDIEVDDAE
jgi:hypothetical protein